MLQSADCKSGFSLVNEYLNRSTMLMKQHSLYVYADEVNEDSLIRTIFVGYDYHFHDFETFRINSRQCNWFVKRSKIEILTNNPSEETDA